MQKKYLRFLIGILSITFVGAMLSCTADKTPLQIQTSLSQNALAYYSDDFDKIREDLWDRAGYLYRDEQVQNFKQADMYTDNGKLVLRTKTGSFSKGGLATKYALRGDFDIELDCRMDFVSGVSRTNMDQLFSFAVLDKSLKPGKGNIAIIGLAMGGGVGQGHIFGNYVLNGKREMAISHLMEHFDGSLRISRKDKQTYLFYKKTGAAEWTLLRTFRLTDKDMLVGFQFRNFFNYRTTIEAKDSISIQIDRFKVNAAQEIIEEEI